MTSKRPTKTLREAFFEICKTYFPRWRDAPNWKITNQPPPGNCEVCGQCDRETKTIFAPTWRSGNSGNLLLVHEICHAVSAPHHGMRWKNRMQKVAARAEELGEAELADSIRTEIAHYENSPSYGELVQDVRQQMEYIGMDLNSDFRLVEKNFARELGVSVAEFRKRLPDAKKLFQSGRANALARKERLGRLKQ